VSSSSGHRLADELPIAEKGGIRVSNRQPEAGSQSEVDSQSGVDSQSSQERSDAVTRRRHERIPARISVRISTIEPDRDPWTGRPFFRSLQETCGNLSRGGAFVVTAEPLDPGKRVLVELCLPSGRELEAIGRVAWVKRIPGVKDDAKESGIGIEFLGGGSREFADLEDFISRKDSA